jgi:hypothetical protein
MALTTKSNEVLIMVHPWFHHVACYFAGMILPVMNMQVLCLAAVATAVMIPFQYSLAFLKPLWAFQ